MAINWTSGFEEGLGQTLFNNNEKWWSSGNDEYGNSTGWTNGSQTSMSPILDSYKNSVDPWDQTWKASLLGNSTGDVGPGMEWAQRYSLDPNQSLQWYNQGINNMKGSNLFAGAQDTLNQQLLPGHGIWNMMLQSGNLTPDVQNQLIQMVDQGDKVKEQYNAADKADSMRAMKTFAGGLAAITIPGLMGMYPGQGLASGLGTGAGEGMVGWDALGNAASGGLGEVGSLGSGSFLGDMSAMSADDWINWGSNLGSNDGLMTNMLNTDYSVPGLGSTPKPNFLENMFANFAYGNGWSGQGAGNLLSQLFGSGGNNMTQPNNQGYRPDWGGMLGALLEYQGQDNMADKLEQYMQQAAGSADPFKPYRPESANMLMSLMRDPMSNPGMQSLALNAKRAMEAKDAAAGRNSQYGERETQLAGLMAGQVPAWAQQLGAMAGVNRAGADADVYSKFAMPMAATELAKSGALGYGVNSAIKGQQPSILQQVMGGPQQSSNIFDFAKQLGGSVFDIFSSWA